MASAEKDILPDVVKPVNYDISLYDLELGGAYSFQGTVNISLKIQKATNAIVINSHQLVLHGAEITVEHTKLQQSIKASDISYDAPKQRATLTFPEELPESNKANLVIKFQGTMNNDMAGFYRSKYKPAVEPAASVPFDGEYHYMFSTQFESSDARRAFPCFDEPNLKATFDFEIELPKDQVALSNMPEKETKEGKNGRHVVSFERTPVMSTYLLAWAVGDFEYIEEFTERKYNGKHLPCRVYTTKGLKEQGRFALEHAHKIVDYYSEVFDLEYPLPKADLLAVHEFSHGAMENWGLVTYRVTAVLFDEKNSSARYKRYTAYVVAHELAHQWFGNLVTMDWWSELWLNEGFATWVGWLATNHLHPEWDCWPYFVSDSMHSGFTLDSLRSSHPIEVPVRDALEVDQIFDHISYRKGSSVIRMLAGHLGNDRFLKGISNYLKAHSYGNATTDDLWSALSEASGQDVSALMDNWIRKIGFPVVSVKEDGDKITLKQSRYLSTGDVKAEDDTTTWWIPLGLKGLIGTEGVASIALSAKEDTISNIDSDFYVLNSDTTGFFRTAYPANRLAKLGQQISKLSTADKIGILADAGALAMSGEVSTPDMLGFTENFSDEENYIVWSQVIWNLDVVKSVFREDEEINKGLNVLTLKLISKALKEIGWEFKPGEEFLTGQLRVLLIGAATSYDHEEAIQEAFRRYEAYISGNHDAINPSLRSVVFQAAIRQSGDDRSVYDALLKEWHSTTTIDGKDLALSALGRVQTPELIASFLQFTFAEVRTQDIHSAASAMAKSPIGRAALWDYIKANFDAVREKLGGNMVVLDRFLRLSLQKFADFEVDADIKQFFEGKDNRGYDRGLAQVSDTIRARAEYKKRDGEKIKAWLREKGYLS